MDVPDPILPASPCPRAPLLVGYSGGLDSSVLLHLMAHDANSRATGLRAIHVHHGLHGDADAWAAHCRHLCAALGVPLLVRHVDVVADAGIGLEAAARHARHAAFADALREGEILVLAHHRDDQAETFLLRALRASGTQGLAAMRRWRGYARGWLWRPLLDMPRARLHAYATRHGLAWVDDDANADLAHDRNFLRHAVLPRLRGRWPHAEAALARSAALAADAEALLQDEDASLLDACRFGDGSGDLHASCIAALPAPRRARVLRRWIATRGLPSLPARGVTCIEAQMLGAANDREARFDWDHASVRRWRDRLHADRIRPPLPADFRQAWDGRAPLPLPGGGLLRLRGATGFQQDLLVHARLGGERIRLPGRAHSHALKHVLQEAGIPPWRRARLPLLSDASGVLLAAGDAILAGEFARWLQQHGAELGWSDG